MIGFSFSFLCQRLQKKTVKVTQASKDPLWSCRGSLLRIRLEAFFLFHFTKPVQDAQTSMSGLYVAPKHVEDKDRQKLLTLQLTSSINTTLTTRSLCCPVQH